MRVSLQVKASKFPRNRHYSDGQKTGHEGIMLKMRRGISNENSRETRTYKIHMTLEVSLWMYRLKKGK